MKKNLSVGGGMKFGRQTSLIQDKDMFKDIEELENIQEKAVRSELHSLNTLKWLKSKGRVNKDIKKNYLLLPEQIQEEMNIRRVFNVFDDDGSNALDLQEMIGMFHRYGMNVDASKIKQIYEIVDETKDNALNYQEFKNCIYSVEVNKIFSEMMNEVSQGQAPQNGENANYFPRTFYSMITYLSYLINRDNKLQKIKGDKKRMDSGHSENQSLLNQSPSKKNQVQQDKILNNMDDLMTKCNEIFSYVNMDDLAVQKDNPYRQQSLKKIDPTSQSYLEHLEAQRNNLLNFLEQEQEDENDQIFDHEMNLREAKYELKTHVKRAQIKGKSEAILLYSKYQETLSAPINKIETEQNSFHGSRMKFKKIDVNKTETHFPEINPKRNFNLETNLLENTKKKKTLKREQSLQQLPNQKLLSEEEKQDYINKILEMNQQLNKGQTQSFKKINRIMQENLHSIDQKSLINFKLQTKNVVRNDLQFQKLVNKNPEEKFKIEQEAFLSQEKEIQAVNEVKNNIYNNFVDKDIISQQFQKEKSQSSYSKRMPQRELSLLNQTSQQKFNSSQQQNKFSPRN